MEEALIRGFTAIGQIPNQQLPGRCVLVKPNLTLVDVRETTSPSVTYAVAHSLVEAGYEVMVAGPTAVIPPDQKGRAIIVGTCLRRLRNQGIFVDGCPPQEAVYSFTGTGTIENALEQALREDAPAARSEP